MTRNPYLVLGVPYGTTESAARRAFAKAAKRAKRDKTFPYTHEDLTAALHEISQIGHDSASDLRFYRVPVTAATGTSEPGVLNPGPEPMARRAPTTDADREALRQAVVAELTSVLLLALRTTVPIDPWDT